MNDRFKFRAWDKATKKIYNVIELCFEYDNFEIHHICLDIPDNADWKLLDNPDKYTLMQSTGLKDKNGKLIYEGDVLAFNGNKNDIGIVKYGEFLPVDIINEYQSETPSIGFYYEPQNVQLEPFCWNVQLIPFLLEKSKAEVIGNIYENPELLEVNNVNV